MVCACFYIYVGVLLAFLRNCPYYVCICFRFGVQGLPELVLYEVPLIKDAHHADIEEEKISSSSLRTRLLGTLLVPPTVTFYHMPKMIDS